MKFWISACMDLVKWITVSLVHHSKQSINDWDLWGCGENTYLCSILHRWPCLHSQLANENEEKCNGKLQTHYYCFSCLAITYHIYHKWDSNGIWQFVRHIHSYRHHNGSQYSVILCFICRLEQAVISKHCVTEPPCWFALITENTLGYFNFSSSLPRQPSLM